MSLVIRLRERLARRSAVLLLLTFGASLSFVVFGVAVSRSADGVAAIAFVVAIISLQGFGTVARRQSPAAIGSPGPVVPVPPGRQDADLLYDFARSLLDLQKGAIDSIDAKVGVIFSVGSAEIGALAAFLALGSSAPKPVEPVLLALSFASYVVLAGVSARDLWTRGWYYGPEVNEVVASYATLEKKAVKLGIANSMIVAFEDNRVPADEKALGLKIVISALIVQTLGLVAAVAVVS